MYVTYYKGVIGCSQTHSCNYSLNTGSKQHAYLPLWETALKELEASENGFKETLLPWQDYPFLHSWVRIQLGLVENTVPLRLCLLTQKSEPTILMHLDLLSFLRVAFPQTSTMSEWDKVFIFGKKRMWCSNTPYQFSVMQARSKVSRFFSCFVLKSDVNLMLLQRAIPCIQFILVKLWSSMFGSSWG